jgi:chromate reductase, NAD(P)H dehydrogenase (quinone)
VLVATRSHVLVEPELLVFGSHGRFDEAGNLTDATTLALLEDLLVQFRDEISWRQHREDSFPAIRTA